MILLNILLIFFIDGDSKGIAKINSIKEKAERAYKAGNYQQAADAYSYLVDTLSLSNDKAIMNLGHSYYKLEDTEKALSSYERLQDSNDHKLRSQAYQQMGVLSKDPQTLQKALAYFKESIKSDPTNNDARYNYELLKKKLKEQEKQDENQQDQDKQDQEKDQEKQDNKDSENQEKSDDQKKDQEQQNKDQEQQEQENEENEEQKSQEQKDQEGKEEQKEQKEGEEGEEEQEQPQPGEEQDENQEDQKTPQQSTSEKLEKMNLSEEKAQMILEALKNSEIQYIQQNRRKPTKRKDSNKPDW